MQLALVLALAFAVAIALFAGQNTTPVALYFLVFRVEQVAVSLLVLVAATLGAALTFALGLVRDVQHRTKLRSLHQQVRMQERRIQELEAQVRQGAAFPGAGTGAEPAVVRSEGPERIASTGG